MRAELGGERGGGVLRVGDPRGWWLVGLAALAVAALLLFGRRRRVVSSAYFLVRRLAGELAAASPFARLRRRAALALFIAAAVAAALAGLAPFFTSGARPLRELVLVDLSPSLGTLEAGKPRFEQLRRRLDDYLAFLQDGDAATFVLALPQAVASLPLDGPAARAFARGLDYHDASADTPGALRLAGTLAAGAAYDHVLLFTDRADRWREGDLAAALAALAPHVVTFGAPVANAGIEAFDIQPDPLLPGVFDLYLRVGCHGPAPRPLVVSLENNGRAVRELRRDCADGAPAEFLVEDLPLERGRAEARIAPGDDFPADDRVFAGVSASPPLKVVLVTAGNRFLRAALESDPGVELVESPPGKPLPRDRRALYVFDGVLPDGALPENALFFQPGGPVDGLQPRSFVAYPQRISWEPDEPILRGVDLEGLLVRGMSTFDEAPAYRAVAAADGRPLILLLADGGRRRVVFSFNPAETNLVFTASYPVLVANCLRWLALFAEGERPFLRVGDAVHLPAAASGGSVRLPDGATVALPAGGVPALPFAGARHPGRYEVSAQDGSPLGALYLNLLDPEVSAGVAAPGFGQGGDALPPGLERGPLHVDLAPWLALAALGFLAAEALLAASSAVSSRE